MKKITLNSSFYGNHNRHHHAMSNGILYTYGFLTYYYGNGTHTHFSDNGHVVLYLTKFMKQDNQTGICKRNIKWEEIQKNWG